MKTLIFTIAMMTAASAFAGEGGNSGGGGKGFVCRNADMTETLYLADTYELEKSGAFKNFSPNEADSLVEAVADLIEQAQPEKIYPHPIRPNEKVSLAFLIEHRQKSLSRVIEKLPEIQDDHIVKVPDGCTKVQLVYQDVKSGVLHENISFTHHMNWLTRGFLDLHEILLSIRNQPGVDTTPIRADVLKYAQMLANPKAKINDRLRGLLGLAPNGKPTEIYLANQYEMNHNCYNRISEGFGTTTEWMKQNPTIYQACLKARQVIEDNREIKVPTLLKMPQDMICKTTSMVDGGLQTRDPKTFTLTRIQGTGAPNDTTKSVVARSLYRFAAAGVSPLDSTRSNLRVEDKLRYQGTKPFGPFFDDLSFGDSLMLSLDSYNERTQLFYGHVSYQNSKTYTGFNISCDGGAAQFGLDPQHAY